LSRFKSFAQRVAALDKMTSLETGISTAIKMSKVPKKEVKKLLVARNEDQVRNTPVFQFMQMIFKEIGLGSLDIKEVGKFSYIFSVMDSPIPSLIPDAKGKTCYITADALSSFFTNDMNIPANGEEIRCVNEGYETCDFLVRLNAIQVYQMALDEMDKEIIGIKLKDPYLDSEKIAENLGIEKEEAEYRMGILRYYELIDEEGNVTDIGNTYYKFRMSSPVSEEVFDPPWKMIKEISSAIAAASSFAEAMSERVKEEKKVLSPEEEDKIINLAEEAKKSRSFAELLAKQIKKEEKEG
jgi:predicted hydrocarbon binding protein